MSNGPIEFLSDTVIQEVPASEMGGEDGLIQPEKPEVLLGDPDASGGHQLSGDLAERTVVSERTQILNRRGMVPLALSEQVTGVSDTGEDVVDPITGRALDGDAIGKAVSGEPGELSDLKPGS